MNSDENFVAIAKHVCPVCLDQHTYNTEILINKKLKAIDPEKVTTGYSLCMECDDLNKNGFLALIEIIDSYPEGNQKVSFQEANRVGNIVHLRREVVDSMFDVPVDKDTPLVFIDSKVMDMLKRIADRLNAT